MRYRSRRVELHRRDAASSRFDAKKRKARKKWLSQSLEWVHVAAERDKPSYRDLLVKQCFALYLSRRAGMIAQVDFREWILREEASDKSSVKRVVFPDKLPGKTKKADRALSLSGASFVHEVKQIALMWQCVLFLFWSCD